MADKPKMHLKFVTPEKVVFEDDVTQVIAPTAAGQITILPNHAALVANLEPGELIINHNGDRQPMVVSGGLIEIGQNQVIVMADTAEQIHEVDLDRAQKAAELAEKLLEEKKFDIKEYDSLQMNLAKNRARVKFGTKWRK